MPLFGTKVPNRGPLNISKWKKITIISGHPSIENSLANKSILKSIGEWDNVNIVHLMEQYPNYQIDVEAEISRLKEADVIVLQFPFQ